MKKFKNSNLGQVLKNIFNFRYWLDYDRTKSLTMYLWDRIQTFFIPQKRPKKVQQFETVVKQLNLDETTLLAQQKGLLRLSIIMCVVAFGFFCYALYHLFWGGWLAVMVSTVLIFLALALAFRYHFWYFQIKKRKLGCSIKEWYREGLLSDKHHE